MQSFCSDFYSTTCNLTGIQSSIQTGGKVALKLMGKGTDSNSIDSNWEWERVTGDFVFANSVGGVQGNPVNNGQGNIGKTAVIQVNGSGTLQFKGRTKNGCGWGNWKYFFWNVTTY